MRKVIDSSSEKTTALKLRKGWEDASEFEMALGGVPETVPKRFRTVNEWAKIWGRTISSTKFRLSGLEKDGKMQAKKFNIVTCGKNFVVNHYKAVVK